MDKKQYQSLLVLVLGFLALGFMFQKLEFLKLVALILGIISIAVPPMGVLVLKGWDYLGMALGWINSRILLSLVFYLILTPIALFSRLFSKDKLKLKQKNRETMWTERNHIYSKSDLSNPW